MCSSLARLPYHEVVEVQAWLEEVQKIKGNCLVDNCVVIARKGAFEPCAKQIDRVGRPLGTGQWAQQEKVLQPIWIDSIFDNGRGR